MQRKPNPLLRGADVHDAPLTVLAVGAKTQAGEALRRALLNRGCFIVVAQDGAAGVRFAASIRFDCVVIACATEADSAAARDALQEADAELAGRLVMLGGENTAALAARCLEVAQASRRRAYATAGR